MSKEKQIEDMVKICHFHNDGICHLCEELLVSCDRKCDLAILVENFYTAGYRKASDVAEEIFAEIEKLFFKNGVFIHIQSYNELKKKYTEEGI